MKLVGRVTSTELLLIGNEWKEEERDGKDEERGREGKVRRSERGSDMKRKREMEGEGRVSYKVHD